jgi:hypothetical protein
MLSNFKPVRIHPSLLPIGRYPAYFPWRYYARYSPAKLFFIHFPGLSKTAMFHKKAGRALK